MSGVVVLPTFSCLGKLCRAYYERSVRAALRKEPVGASAMKDLDRAIDAGEQAVRLLNDGVIREIADALLQSLYDVRSHHVAAEESAAAAAADKGDDTTNTSINRSPGRPALPRKAHIGVFHGFGRRDQGAVVLKRGGTSSSFAA